MSTSTTSQATAVDVLRERALRAPEDRAYIFLPEGEAEGARLTWAELDGRARAVASVLQERGLAGERVLLVLPPGLGFVAAFFGCLYAGAVAVPCYPPRSERNLSRLLSIADDASPRAALTCAAVAPAIPRWQKAAPELERIGWIDVDALPSGAEAAWLAPEIGSSTLAFLQYTSGSTTAPKGVMVSHGNLVHNERLIQHAFRQSESSLVVGWLPLYHDMGLIGNVLQPLWSGSSCVLMPPLAFLQKPRRWLEAIHRYRATTSGGPNFAYELCLEKVAPAEREGLDLSCWSVAFNGAEPVRAVTQERFAEAFAPYGFRREAFYPCYGLAEATLFVAGGVPGEPAAVRELDAETLAQNRAEAARPGAPARTLVSCGRPWLGQELAIVDPETGAPCGAGRVGEVWVAGESVAAGYWNRPEETASSFGALLPGAGERPFLRTGDLGFVLDGELFVTGRLKDLVILRGRNHYPQDLELTAESSHRGLRPGCGAAFSVEIEGGERLVIVQEVERHAGAGVEEMVDAIRRAIASEHEVQVHEVVLARFGAVPKTTSGKVQRGLCRSLYLAGRLLRVDGGVLAETSAPAGAGDAEGTAEGFLRQTFARLARIEPFRIAPDRPLTALGLDSLMAVELKAGVEAAYGMALPLASLLEGASIREIAGLLSGRPAAGDGLPPLRPDMAEAGDLPLSEGQKALWFLDRLAPEAGACNIAVAARVRGGLKAAALRSAFEALVLRHSALRSVFPAAGKERSGEPVRRVEERPELDFRVEDATGWSEDRLQAELSAEAWRPFELDCGPLMRVRIFDRSDRGSDPVLLLVVHHIAADFASFAVAARELAAGGGPPLRVAYGDFVRWQAEALSGPRGERLRDFWSRALAGVPDLDLPTDRPRPPVQTWRGAARLLELPPDLVAGTRGLASAHGATPFMVLLAAFQAQLGRISGQEDLAVGTPTAGRSLPELAPLMGYFVNPVALRADLSGEPSFAELLGRVRRTVIDGLEHGDFPFARIAERLRPMRDPSRPPLFQAMFLLQGARPGDPPGLATFALGESGGRLSLGDLELESLRIGERRAQLDLTLRVAEEGDGRLRASLEFNTDLLDAATAQRMLGHFCVMLEGAVADASLPVSRLRLLSPAEREELLAAGHAAAADHPRDLLLHQLFEAQAARTPEAEALVVDESRLTYLELNARANQLGRHLQSLGVGPEVRVGVRLGRGADLIVSLLGVLKAGGAYVALDPEYPQERLELMRADCGARVMIEDLGGLALDRYAASDLAPAARPENLAYLIYTSGSTGRPKAVALEHRSPVALVHWARRVFSAEELSGVLASTSVAFDLSVFEIFVPLSWGGRVILAGNALKLPRLAAAGEVRLVNTVPSALAELVRSGGLPSSVRTVNLAGEPVPPALVEAVYAVPGVERLYNLYGPSEDTTYSTFTRLVPGQPVTIGRPLDGTRSYVLNGRLELMPEGVAGELYLGGPGLARGYLGRPELTAERFVPDLFADGAGGLGGGRLYRTGDLARWRKGELEFLGRADQQVKIRGFRIELGEIEAALSLHPAVREAAVLALPERSGTGLRLVACVSLSGGEPALAAWLRERLPEAFVPTAWVVLPSLPLSPNGKVDRKALAAIAPEAPVKLSGGPPRTPVEEALAGIFAEVLALERVGVHDDFFALGGHSLLAARVVSRLHAVFGVELPLRVLFERPSVEKLAGAVEEARTGPAERGAPPLLPVPRDRALSLSFAQERLWFLDRLEPGQAVYNIPLALRLRGPVSAPALAAALLAAAERHEALRATFPEAAGKPVLEIASVPRFPLAAVDLTGLAPDARPAEAARQTVAEARSPFDLAAGPLCRAALLRLAEEEHLFLIDVHHIVFDGWSREVLLRDLERLYTGEPLPPLPVQYAGFAVWQRAWIEGRAIAAQLDAWRARLDGAPAALDLPLDRPRPAAQTFRGGAEPVTLPAGLMRDLRAAGRRAGATLFMTILAGWSVLLHRVSGAPELLVGTPVANRRQPELRDLVGLFVNTLPLRIDLSGDPSFTDLLGRVRATALAAYDHQDLPFERLVEAMSAGRDLSRNPLFQVMLALTEGGPPSLRLPGVEAEEVPFHNGTAKLELLLALTGAGGALSGGLEFNSDLFDAATARRLADQLVRLFAGAADRPDHPIGDLPLLSAAEERQILDWNTTAAPFPRHMGLHELFEAQAVRTPQATALIHGERQVTYAELNARADGLARHLYGLGVGPEVLVGVFCGRTPGMVAAALAVLKAGGVYLPLDPAYPADRLRFLLADSGAPVVLAEESVAGKLPGFAGALVCVDRDSGQLGPKLPRGFLHPEQAAYAIYTSGSTGVPKGVLVRHGSAVARITWAVSAYPPDVLAGVLAATSLCFDLSVFEIFAPLAAGGAVVLADDALALLSHPSASAVTLVNTVPSAMAELVRAGALPRSVRVVNLAGEPLRSDLVRRIHAQGVEEVHNLYGPSEDTTYSTGARAGKGDEREPSIGLPLPNSRAYLLDPRLHPVPVGTPGELWLGGEGLARGYLRRPDLTADRFRPDPFGQAAGSRLYRTGDRARRRADGALDYLGRLDQQVKIRGFRIEPGEIEAVLSSLSGVRETAVAVREDTPGDRRLVAYVVADATGVTVDALRRALRERLPDSMVPSAFVLLAALPVTPNGKVDRGALPAPEWRDPKAGFVPPGTPTEELLAGLWAELLGVDRVGAADDFFALGGHSLHGVQLASRVRDRIGVALPVRQIFSTPTLEGLARWLEIELAGGTGPTAPPVVPVPREGPLPLSFAQRRIWFLDRLEPGPAYVIPLAVEMEGALQVAALAKALAAVTERHEILRTVFPEQEGEPRQVILSATAGCLPVVDLEGLPPALREPEAHRLAQREASRPFDLERGPLVRFRLLRLGLCRHLLLGMMHHIVSDGWSVDVLLSEMSVHYEGREPKPLAVQYADYAVWQRESLAGEVLDRELTYWRRQLAGVALLELPTDHPRPAVRSARGASLLLPLPVELCAGVKRLARQLGATPFMVFLAAYQALLSRLSGQMDLTVGTPVASRGRSELEGLIGCFINSLVLRAGFAASTTFEGALASARGSVLEAHAHQEVPFERLVEELQPQRSLSHTPLFQALLTYQEPLLRHPRLGEVSLAQVWIDRSAAQLDLTLGVQSRGEQYLAGLEYATSLFDRTTIERLAVRLERMLASVVERPEGRVADLPLLSEAERHQLCVEWNDSTGEVGDPELVQGMFERQAERSPDDIALTFGGRSLTYRELNAQANRLAHWLKQQGVGPEVRVGVQCERSPEMVVAMLAVHKAGGAYVPMDPSYPRERLALILNDAGIALVLTRPLLREWAGNLDRQPAGNPPLGARPDNAAYVIYTSGSTGRPKGVVVTHRNAAGFFAAMDHRLGAGERGVWLAVTSISFDISVLEILWTLSRGFEVVLQPEAPGVEAVPALPLPAARRALEFSLFYFASESGADAGHDSYRLLLEGARFADRHGFKAVWTPERHFHEFGGLYPNPAVLGAALAVATERVEIRAGSVVMPLQSPLRVAEEWAVVDRLSGGRVGISFASGWHADDFVLAPESYGRRKDVMIDGIEAVRRLWRGETVLLPNGVGREVPVRVHPRPLQGELPVWLTAAGNEETFRLAGHLKAGLLTHLLGQSIEELAAKVAVYRDAWREAGGEGEGHVTLMLHTFVGDGPEAVRESVRTPFRRYLRSSFGLLRNLAGSLGREVDLEALTPEDEELLLDLAFDRYFATAGLFGTPGTCLHQLDRLRGAGVDEVACLIDFGVEVEATLAGLERLHELKERSRAAPPALPEEPALPVEEQIRRHGVTHLQCTPSMARMLVSEPAGVAALGSLRKLLVGGEALPPVLARQLREAAVGEVHNMYGPTETTVWSSTHRLDDVSETVPIGRPLLNTGLFILDRTFAPCPYGVPGELLIGGRGVARGYLGRPDLTAERFVPDPFSPEPGGRLYATGDRARYRPDGVVEFLGRVDHQVKIRGHRIELGEIEAVLMAHPAVETAAVAVREERPGEPVLVAYAVPIRALRPLRPALSPEQAASWLAGHKRAILPNGLEIAVLGDFQAQGLYQEIFQSRIYLRNGIELHDGDCVFDVGANVGSFTLFACQQARNLQIHAFEPIPPTFETLRLNVGLYGLAAELHNCGLSARSEEAEFTFYPSMSGLSGRYSEASRDMQATREVVLRQLRAQAGDSAVQSIEGEALENLLAEQFRSERHRCRLRTLSEVIRERKVERIDLLKIDVERAEVDVLLGIEEEDWDRIGQIVMEVDGHDNLEMIVSLLERRGFQVVVEELHPDGETAGRSEVFFAHLYARRRSAGPAATEPVPLELSAAGLRAFLRERLPAYMLPSHLVVLDALPLTPNGKVDRRALPPPEAFRTVAEGAYEAPATELQKVIAGVWSAVLQTDRVGLHDNFFELGGTSLSLVEVRSRLREALGREVSLVDLFRSPTVDSLAKLFGNVAEVRVSLEVVEDRGRQQGDALRQGTSAVQRRREFLTERRERKRAMTAAGTPGPNTELSMGRRPAGEDR